MDADAGDRLSGKSASGRRWPPGLRPNQRSLEASARTIVWPKRVLEDNQGPHIFVVRHRVLPKTHMTRTHVGSTCPACLARLPMRRFSRTGVLQDRWPSGGHLHKSSTASLVPRREDFLGHGMGSHDAKRTSPKIRLLDFWDYIALIRITYSYNNMGKAILKPSPKSPKIHGINHSEAFGLYCCFFPPH